MKRQFTLALLVIVLAVATYLWKSQAPSTVVIEGHYMQYACGDDNIDMQVQKIDHPDFQQLVDQDIAPFAGYFKQSDLITFVSNSTLPYQQGQEKYLKNFTIIGRISNGDADAGCEKAVKVYVDKIKYGTGDFKSF